MKRDLNKQACVDVNCDRRDHWVFMDSKARYTLSYVAVKCGQYYVLREILSKKEDIFVACFNTFDELFDHVCYLHSDLIAA